MRFLEAQSLSLIVASISPTALLFASQIRSICFSFFWQERSEMSLKHGTSMFPRKMSLWDVINLKGMIHA